MVASRKEGYDSNESATKNIIIAVISVVYSVWLLYAAGPKYLLLSALLYLPGVTLYTKARKEYNRELFNNIEKVILAILVIAALYALYGLTTGSLEL